MAKKKNEPQAPEVSSLPIKQDEGPLVIDLPDGQKLVVGHLANGSVIEVATWRGTGRPDSRTSRLMLGMSSAASAAEQAAAEEAKKEEKPQQKIAPFVDGVKKFAATLAAKRIAKNLNSAKPVEEKAESKPFIKAVTPELASDDVQDWLNSIIAKSEKKVAMAETQPVKKTAAKKTVRKATAKSRKGRGNS